LRLDGARCLITGCSSGIGRALVTGLAGQGATVIATARRLDSIADLAADRVQPMRVDVTDPPGIRAVMDTVGPVDVLVNNAGYGLLGAVEEVDDDELLAQFETNLFGAWRMCRAVLPGMRERRSGAIVNISSVGGQAPFPNIGAYRASKFAMECLSWTLHFEVSHFGIRVLDVQPGLVATNFDTTSRRVARRATEASPYAEMRAGLDAVYARMSPSALAPEEVAANIIDELRRPGGRYRLRIGSDAEQMAALVAAGDDAVESYLVDGLGFLWHPPSPRGEDEHGR
jgi:NAD(P)-dependent dehydrogenase (short-subunit alcohol dehydrogenase family)